MIAIDTNILVKAHRRDAEDHGPARAALERLAAGRARWALPWQSLHEFFGVFTHPRVFDPPSAQGEAVAQIEACLEAPSVELIGESRGYWPVLREQLQRGRVTGARVHDARIAAVCLFHGVTELWTADRDFGRFPCLRVRNPLLRGRPRARVRPRDQLRPLAGGSPPS